MKTLLSVLILTLCASARAAILVGPLTNPANGHTYYLLSRNNWSNAEAEAVSLGGHLATIRNAAEDHWIYSTFAQYGGALWIGLTDRQKPFQFQWVSGEPMSYTNWGGGQPDNVGGAEFYVHILPRGHYLAGKWNDYEDSETVLAEQFPLYGVAEVLPVSNVRLSLPSPSKSDEAVAASDSSPTITVGPELRAFTAIELTWTSEANKVYQIQWTRSIDQPDWQNLGPAVAGTGQNLSIFDSTKLHPRGFYRLRIVQ